MQTGDRGEELASCPRCPLPTGSMGVRYAPAREAEWLSRQGGFRQAWVGLRLLTSVGREVTTTVTELLGGAREMRCLTASANVSVNVQVNGSCTSGCIRGSLGAPPREADPAGLRQSTGIFVFHRHPGTLGGKRCSEQPSCGHYRGTIRGPMSGHLGRGSRPRLLQVVQTELFPHLVCVCWCFPQSLVLSFEFKLQPGLSFLPSSVLLMSLRPELTNVATTEPFLVYFDYPFYKSQ